MHKCVAFYYLHENQISIFLCFPFLFCFLLENFDDLEQGIFLKKGVWSVDGNFIRLIRICLENIKKNSRTPPLIDENYCHRRITQATTE